MTDLIESSNLMFDCFVVINDLLDASLSSILSPLETCGVDIEFLHQFARCDEILLRQVQSLLLALHDITDLLLLQITP